MKKNIIIFILIFLIMVLSFTFFIKEAMNLNKLNNLKSSFLQKEHAYEVVLTNFIVTYDSLFKNYQELYGNYQEQAILLTKQEANNAQLEDWVQFEVTAYSQESGMITSIGIDLKANYSKYLSIAAVDPEVIPYGSTLLIKLNDGSIKAFIAADCGGKIKGNKIDLYFTDQKEAIKFGRQKLQVKMIK